LGVTHPVTSENQLGVKKRLVADPESHWFRGFPHAWVAVALREKGRTSVHTYLVERYWPGVTIERLLEALEREAARSSQK
jgi:hypothetical protein